MKVLHYSLGFPPYRKGGMTMYCLGLIEEQVSRGFEVAMIWPGRYLKHNKRTKIIKRSRRIIGSNKDILSYELQNPALVPLIEGISKPKEFMKERSIEEFIEFFSENKWDVFHVHTLMGLPKECIEAAKKLNIKILFTTHDYYGLCPNCSFMIGNNICTDDNNCIKCIQCNESALSLRKIILLQSPLYRVLKDFILIKYLRKKHVKKINKEYETIDKTEVYYDKRQIENKATEYKKLRDYYIYMLNRVDFIHYNSENTKRIYEKFVNNYISNQILTISNKSVANNKKNKIYYNKIRFGYLGPITFRKGFFELIDTMNNLYRDGFNNFELHIYDNYTGNIEYLIEHQPYQHDNLKEVMSEIDILIVPSLCDTFGFTVLEALSYGVPVICSQHVGAKDLIDNRKSGYVYGNLDELYEILKQLIEKPITELSIMNNYIVDKVKIKEFKEHSIEIENLYIKLIEGEIY